jgi:hypothetical protein
MQNISDEIKIAKKIKIRNNAKIASSVPAVGNPTIKNNKPIPIIKLIVEKMASISIPSFYFPL